MELHLTGCAYGSIGASDELAEQLLYPLGVLNFFDCILAVLCFQLFIFSEGEKNMNSLYIVMPAYNEESNIE